MRSSPPRRWCSPGHSVGTCVGLGSHADRAASHRATRQRRTEKALRHAGLARRTDQRARHHRAGRRSDVARIRTRAVRGRRSPRRRWQQDVHRVRLSRRSGHGGRSHGRGRSRRDLATRRRAPGTEGFSVSKKLAKTGWWASDTAELSFDACRVPVENIVGGENTGFLAIMLNFATERSLPGWPVRGNRRARLSRIGDLAARRPSRVRSHDREVIR